MRRLNLEIFDINPVLPIDSTHFSGLNATEKDTELFSKLNELIDRNKILFSALRENNNEVQGDQ